MPRSTRYRQLRRLAERRQAEKRDAAATRRQRLNRIAIALGAAVVVAGLVAVGSSVIGGGGGGGDASPTPSRSPESLEGQKVGSVVPDKDLNDTIKVNACDAPRAEDNRRPKPQFAQPKQVLEPGAPYYAHIDTSCGEIVIELFADAKPTTVNSFVFLAGEGFFDNMRFHRIASSISVIQAGDPIGVGTGGPGYQFDDELDGTETYGPGTVAMANAGPNTNGSQFFIVYGTKASVLGPSYTVFGKVVKGLDVAKRIAKIPVLGNTAANPAWAEQPSAAVWIYSITITDTP